jgi:hypothetical protein
MSGDAIHCFVLDQCDHHGRKIPAIAIAGSLLREKFPGKNCVT